MSQGRINLNNIYGNLLYIIYHFNTVIFYSCGLLKPYVFLGFLIAIITLSYLCFMGQTDKNNLINILFIPLFTIIASFSIFLATLSSFDCGRMYIILGGLPSMLLLYLYINNTISQGKNKIFVCIYLIAILWISINLVNFLFRINESRYKNILEKEYCNAVLEECNKNGYVLKEACIIPVSNYDDMIYFNQIKTKNKLTINEIKGFESAISGFNVATMQNLKEIKVTKEIYEKYLEQMSKGNKGINNTYIMYIDNVLVMPAFIW